MTSPSAVFIRRVNPMALVEASRKKYLPIHLKKLKFLLLTGEMVENVFKPMRKPQFKICNFACSNP